jgi:hypothetical protein
MTTTTLSRSAGFQRGTPFGTSIGYEKGEALFCKQSVTCLFFDFEIWARTPELLGCSVLRQVCISNASLYIVDTSDYVLLLSHYAALRQNYIKFDVPEPQKCWTPLKIAAMR